MHHSGTSPKADPTIDKLYLELRCLLLEIGGLGAQAFATDSEKARLELSVKNADDDTLEMASALDQAIASVAVTASDLATKAVLMIAMGSKLD